MCEFVPPPLLWHVLPAVMLLQLARQAARGVGVFHQLPPACPSLLPSDVGCLTGCCQISSLYLGTAPCSNNKAHKLSLLSRPILFLHQENSFWPVSKSGSQTSVGLASSLASSSPPWIYLAPFGSWGLRFSRHDYVPQCHVPPRFSLTHSFEMLELEMIPILKLIDIFFFGAVVLGIKF